MRKVLEDNKHTARRTVARRLVFVVLFMMLAVEALWAWPWSHDMEVQPIVRPLFIMFQLAPGSVAIGSELSMPRKVADRTLHNPLTATPENLAVGKELFDTTCAVCHGKGGRGDGPAAGHAMPAANLTIPLIQQESDGLIYDTVRNGLLAMPEYSESLSVAERWQVILYMRSLGQKTK